MVKVYSLAIAVLAVLLVALFVWWSSANTTFFSVEFGLAELSPKGDAGGYAMPASGASAPDGLRHSCAADGSSVTLSWNRSVYRDLSGIELKDGNKYASAVTSNGFFDFVSTRKAHAGGGGWTHNHPEPAPVTYQLTIRDPACFEFGGGGAMRKLWKFFTGAHQVYAGSNGGNCQSETISGISSNSHTMSITPDKTYSWLVAACAGGACSVSSGSPSGNNNLFSCPGRPTLNLTADDYSVPYDTGTTLRWSSTNTNSCTASGAWSGSRPTSGSEGTGALRHPTTYLMQCSGNRGNTQPQSVTISVENGEGAYISACNNVVYKDKEFCINYNVGTSAPEHCVIEAGSNIIAGPLAQSQGSIDWSITGETTFTLNCEEGGNIDSITVKVLPEFQET